MITSLYFCLRIRGRRPRPRSCSWARDGRDLCLIDTQELGVLYVLQLQKGVMVIFLGHHAQLLVILRTHSIITHPRLPGYGVQLRYDACQGDSLIAAFTDSKYPAGPVRGLWP